MRLYFAILLVSVFVVTAPGASTDGDYERLSAQGINLAYNLKFDEATNIFQNLIRLQPDNPHGYLLMTVNYYYRYQLEENHQKLADKFNHYSKKAIERAKSQLRDPEHQVDALFYLGTAHMYLAAYHGWESNWLRAYWYGRDGINYLQRVVERDPDYYDAYLGLGLYHYYTDVIPKFAKAVTFILGIDSDREKGLAELELAAENGLYSKAEALLFLGSIHLYVEKDYTMAEHYFRKLADLYPENGSFLMMLGETYQKLGKNALAARTLHQLVDSANTSKMPVLVSSSHFRLGNLYYNERDLPKAISHYQKSLEFASHSTGNIKWVNALANLNLGRSYDLLGRRDIAISYYRRVKKSDHKHAYEKAQERLEHPLVRTQRPPKNRNFDEIIEIYQGALAKSRNEDGSYSRNDLPELTYNIAKEMYERGAYQSALTKFLRVTTMENVSEPWLRPWAHFYSGQCYLKLGDTQKALAHFDRTYPFEDSRLKAEIAKIRDLMSVSNGSN